MQCLIDREPGLEVKVWLTNQLQCILIRQKVKHGLLLKAAREISSGMLKPFADFFPPIHRYCFMHAPKNSFATFSPPRDKTRTPERSGRYSSEEKIPQAFFVPATSGTNRP